MIVSNSLSTAEIDKTGNVTNTEEQTHQLFANSIVNTTTYYVQMDYDYLDFRIAVNHWGDNLGGLYQGLIIKLVIDSNDTELNSWLISYNDGLEHYFFTEDRISGIIRIVFICMNVGDIGFNLIIENELALWTYELLCKPQFDTYFGVERSEVYLDVQQFVLEFERNFSNENMFSVGVYNENNVSEEYIESSMIYFPENNLILGAYATPENWYRLSFELENYNSTDWIAIRLFYDHVDTQFIVRLFLNKGDNSLDEIPLDIVHSDNQYRWYIEYYHPIDIGPYYVFIVILNVLKYIIITVLIVGTIAAIVRAITKRRRKETALDFNPSQKYEYSNASVSYKPQPTHVVNFDYNPKDYEIRTSESSKVSCSICLQIIEDHSDLIRCPSCDIAYHKKHLYQWIVGNGTCPACRSRLRITSK